MNAIEPGQSFQVAFEFHLEAGWHTYWINSGDAGLPPEVRWDLPEGFQTSALIHPAPKRHNDPGGLVTFIHEDRPILAATLTPPTDLQPGTTLEIKGEMRFLVCKVQCIKMTKPFSLELPVVKVAAEVSAANEKVFARARRKFPQSISKAKYAKITPVLNVDKIRPKDKFKLAVVVDIDKGYHIQSHEPLTANYIATDVFLEPTEDIFFEEGGYPEHHIRTYPGNLKAAEYSGRVVIRFDGQADNTLSQNSLRFAGVLRYQACNDKGSCFPPQNIAWEVTVPTGQEGDAVKQVGAEYFGVGSADATAHRTEQPDDRPNLAKALDATANLLTTKGKGLPAPVAESDGSDFPDSASGQTAQAGGADITVGPPKKIRPPSQSVRTPQPQSSASMFERIEELLGRFGVVGLLIGCFLYGLFLNATPCVLPLLSIKVLGFVQQAHESRKRTLGLGLSFGLGVVLFFIALGFIAAAGKNLLQYPVVVIGLGAVVMALALSMLGVYTLKAPETAAKIEANIQQEGMLASFGKGALAPVLGFACTGPMLAAAFGWATQQPATIAVFAFLVAGLGMAFPYMLMGANPKWLSFLPKPGQWMITFERIMGFLLLAMVVWLIHPLITQIGPEGLEWTLGFFVAVALGCWLIGKVNMTMPSGVRWRYRGGATAIVALAGLLIYGVIYPIDDAMNQQKMVRTPVDPMGIVWQPWSTEAVLRAVDSGKPVFVDFTAAWCTVCKVNKKRAINTPEVQEKMEDCGVVRLRGDYTTEDAEIFAELQKHQRAGVPLNLIYPAGRPEDPIVLDTNLSKQYLLDKLDRVCGSSDDLAFGP